MPGTGIRNTRAHGTGYSVNNGTIDDEPNEGNVNGGGIKSFNTYCMLRQGVRILSRDTQTKTPQCFNQQPTLRQNRDAKAEEESRANNTRKNRQQHQVVDNGAIFRLRENYFST